MLLSVASSLRTIGPDAYGDDAPVYGWWRPGGRREAAANVTGNALNRRVGYRAVEDHVVREFDAEEVAGHGM